MNERLLRRSPRRRGIILFDLVAALVVMLTVTGLLVATLHRSGVARRQADQRRAAVAAAEVALLRVQAGAPLDAATSVVEPSTAPSSQPRSPTVRVESLGSTAAGEWVRVVATVDHGKQVELHGLRNAVAPGPAANGGVR